MWQTRTAAIKEIRDRTGVPEVEAMQAVMGRPETETTPAIKAMPTKRFGSRDMVHRLSIEEFIAETNMPPAPPKNADRIRPLSAKKLARIRVYGEMPRARVG